MGDKIICLTVMLLISLSMLSQTKEDRYIKLSQFESKEFFRTINIRE